MLPLPVHDVRIPAPPPPPRCLDSLQAQDFIEDEMSAQVKVVKWLGDRICEVGAGQSAACRRAGWCRGGKSITAPRFAGLWECIWRDCCLVVLLRVLQLKRVGKGHGVFHFDEKIDQL